MGAEKYSIAAGTESARPSIEKRKHLTFSSSEWLHLGGLYGTVALLHIAGWSLYLYYSADYPALVGLGFVAYLFGLRHAFDADHISAIDDTVRYMLQKRRRPLGVGFFFSLGHSTIVFGLSVVIIFAAAAVKNEIPAMQNAGGLIGASVSGVFLWIIGVINLLVLLNILQVWKKAKAGTHDHAHLNELLSQRGFINRLFGGRLRKLINHSWQMYPVGFLFGLGFDTASEVGLLAMTAGASAGDLPWPAVLSLPVLFTAGMSLMDTTDGVVMCKAYNWAFINPLRKIFYNLTTTSLSVAVALIIGTVEMIQVFASMLDLNGPFFGFFAGLNFGYLGYIIVGLFILAWGISIGVWKFGHLEEKYAAKVHSHEHTHKDGTTHSHPHIHRDE
jgi:high-affinity nickel-transport protein